MDCIEFSDLEEGEILENENDSLSNLSESWSDEFGGVKNHSELGAECKNKKSGSVEKKSNCLPSLEINGNENSTRKQKLPDKSGNKSNITIIDLALEKVSSDGDSLSDDGKHLDDSFDYKIHKNKRSQFNGTAEDIMSEIGETISRKKSHCSHRKRKARHSFDRYKDNYNLWRHKTSHAKVKKPRRRLSSDGYNSDDMFTQERKRKKRSSYLIEETVKKPKIRDFDEMRQTLLEKLKKQKAAEANSRVENLTPAEEVENSEIQEVEMVIDSTNYVDNPTIDSPSVNNVNNANLSNVANQTEKNEDDDLDLDLTELRLAALESNSKQRANVNTQRRKNNKEQSESENGKTVDMDLDRYELLLRAEALKTALLKKHQKRLNKAKEMSSGTNSSSNNNIVNTLSTLKRSSSDEKPSTSGMSNGDVFEENTQNQNESLENTRKSPVDEVRVTTASSTVPSLNQKKGKTKRKKRKSDSLQNNAKENTDALEEDDRLLRTQLLNDLLRKKSLKNLDKKPVLTDSVQTSANQLPVISSEKAEEKSKPVAAASKKNSLQKVSVVNTTKPTLVPRIPKPEIKRIIVHLGSEDSSDENNAEEILTLKNRENKQENMTTKKSSESLTVNHEKSVEMLLSQTWKKIEGEIAAAKNAHGTPEAVYKHLPLSQRLEYVRLKQKIAERERLKKINENLDKPSSGPSKQDSTSGIETASQNSASLSEAIRTAAATTTTTAGTTKTTVAASKLEHFKPVTNLLGTSVLSKNVPLSSKTVKNLNQVNAKKPVANSKVIRNSGKHMVPLNGLNAKQTNQRSSLLQSSQALLSKLKLLLKKIKIEKTIEENYDKEISKLKIQINLFEKKKLEQKFKIKKLVEESSKTYKVIQQITNLNKKPKEDSVNKKGSGGGEPINKETVKAANKSKNETVKAPEEFKNESVTAADESKSDISKAESNTEKELNESDNVSLPNAGLLNYNSPLQVFSKTSENLDRVDPNVMLCQFDLMGVCKDKECTYQHFRNPQSLECSAVVRKPVKEELNSK